MAENPPDPLNSGAYRVAKETRDFEIGLFWQRSNYFLLLSTALAVGFFSMRGVLYSVGLAVFGFLVAWLWLRVNLGGTFWQRRWEHRLRLAEEKVQPNPELFSASPETIREDVRLEFDRDKYHLINPLYAWLVRRKPSVSRTMTMLSVIFAIGWVLALVAAATGHATAPPTGGNELPMPVVRHEDLGRPWWLSVSEALKNGAEIAALIVAGCWAYKNFVAGREGRPVLEIDLTFATVPGGEERFVTYFDVTLTNKSKRKVLARIRRPEQPAFSDNNECLQHSCSLLLRKVDQNTGLKGRVGWFSDPDAKSPLPTDIVSNLAECYEYQVEGKEDFFVEPTEAAHLSVGMVLEQGIYLALVTVVGEPPDDSEFWRREFLVQISHARGGRADNTG